jgi:hypothetical protein
VKSIDADAALALKTWREFQAACQNKDLGARLLVGLLYNTTGYTSQEALELFIAQETVARALYSPEDMKP